MPGARGGPPLRRSAARGRVLEEGAVAPRPAAPPRPQATRAPVAALSVAGSARLQPLQARVLLRLRARTAVKLQAARADRLHQYAMLLAGLIATGNPTNSARGEGFGGFQALVFAGSQAPAALPRHGSICGDDHTKGLVATGFAASGRLGSGDVSRDAPWAAIVGQHGTHHARPPSDSAAGCEPLLEACPFSLVQVSQRGISAGHVQCGAMHANTLMAGQARAFRS